MPYLDLSARKPPDVVFRPVGRNSATTFTGLCGDHDRELFAAIETIPVQTTDARHLFLLAYRAVLKEAHASRKSAIDVHASYLEGVKKGVYPEDEPSPVGLLACECMTAAHLVNAVKTVFDNAYLQDNWDAVNHQVCFTESRPTVAVNSMFSTNLWSRFLDAPAFVMFNVFPVAYNKTAVVLSSTADQRPEAMAAFGHILLSRGSYQQYELSKLILKKAQNVVIAPSFFDTLTAQQRETARQYFMRNMAGHTFELDDPDLFLFWPNPTNSPTRVGGAVASEARSSRS